MTGGEGKPKNPTWGLCTGAPTAGLINGFAPPPGRPQNAPGLIAVPGEKGVITCMGAADTAVGVMFCAGLCGEGCGRKVKGGMEGVIGGRPCGVIMG